VDERNNNNDYAVIYVMFKFKIEMSSIVVVLKNPSKCAIDYPKQTQIMITV